MFYICNKKRDKNLKVTKGNRLHIGFFGKRNVGKSSLINKITGQDLSIVSDMPGTTTDVNQKSMELLPIGPVVLMDTAGYDDTGELGNLRVERTDKALIRTDVAVVVFDDTPLGTYDNEFLNQIKEKNIPLLSVINKSDKGRMRDCEIEKIKKFSDGILEISALCDNDIIMKFKQALIKIIPEDFISQTPILSDIIKPFETVVLVIPIDKEAPKGRIILPQVNVLRDLLDTGAISVVTRETELEDALSKLKEPPKIVVTDSQAFRRVNEIVPENILMTSFSILFARLKGDLNVFAQGAKKLNSLHDKDKILILESCTHHPVEDDIGRVKIPSLIKKYTQKDLIFEHKSGHDFPKNISDYALIIHCGACMTNRREILNRINISNSCNVAITNYGIAIAKCLGILDRALKPFEK